jgi:hypothetical protein
MKTRTTRIRYTLAFAVATLITFSATGTVSAQDNTKSEPHKKVVVKIYSDDNGTKTVVDTTMEFSAETLNDSVNREIEKVIELGKSGKQAHVKIKGMPKEFNYNFEIPSLPDCPMALNDLNEIEFEGDGTGHGMEDLMWEEMTPAPRLRIHRNERGGQSLNDLLGDIPMDRVKNYSIKDTRNGKRIVIDLNDEPVVDRKSNVIVIREPGIRPHAMHQPPHRRVRVTVNPDDQKMEETPEAPVEQGNAPPPAGKPEKK